MNKNELWNKFAGKKILMIRNDGTCETNVVVGCDPDIGICFARVGEEQNPWWVYHGSMSPYVLNREIELADDLDVDILLNHLFNQLRSGCVSEQVNDDFIVTLLGHDIGSGIANLCPYSA